MIKTQIAGKHLIHLDKINSTNLYALELLQKKEIPEGTIIIVREQFSGRGQNKNRWESEPGKNLTFSIILHPAFLLPEKQFQLNKFISLAIFDFVSEVMPGQKVSIKWTNDIYINDDKVAGILINNVIQGHSFSHSVIGIGLNINQAQFTSDAPNPVSLKMITGKNYDLEECLNILCLCIDNRYYQLMSGKTENINNEYFTHQYRLDSFYPFLYKEEKVIAKITGFDPFGRLLLVTEKGGDLSCDQQDLEYLIGGK
ncbi:MAG: biotin--[acetyl-CoA-carboxylase] ligase [Bacteroidales bacterium]|nr:biotin--[acetyl-CoA-carboxylase] ligase [Bacteroidales bacterium]